MKLTHKIVFLLSAAYLSSCSNQPSVLQKTDSLHSQNSLAGKVYSFGSEFDSTNLVATGDGDCSFANTLFLDDSSFLEIEYCEDGATYSMGKYRADDRLLSLIFDGVNVNEYFPETEDTASAKSGKPVYRISLDKPQTRIYQKLEYKGVTLFVNRDIGAPDKEKKYSDMLKAIHDDGIWDKLHTNPASIPKNSTAIEYYLQGNWARPGDTTDGFKIMEDSIYYFNIGRKLPYRINHDSLRILFAHNELVYPVKIMGSDTLIFEGPEKQIYYRFNRYQ